MRNFSKQRESIRTYLDEHRTHPTAETVYLDLKKEFPKISLGTVYRNLNLLADDGEILRISSGSGPDHYDGNRSPHYHLICEECGRVIDINVDLQIQLEELANRHFDGKINSHVTHFFGQCPECYKNK